jgi:acetyltransferase-like isoleucine patch superfamily enzyme
MGSYPGRVQAQITDQSLSSLQRYQRIVLGSDSFRLLLRYELITLLLGSLPGAAGLWLRRKTYPRLLRSAGSGVVFGRNTVLRYPDRIAIGANVVLDDGCVLDARGDSGKGIAIGNEVMLARHVILGCKNGDISLGDNVGVGAYSVIHAVGRSGVTVGDNVAIGAYTYLVGGSHYHMERSDIPVSQQGLDLRGGIRIRDNVWLGARVTVLDGVTIGRDAVVGAEGALMVSSEGVGAG